jgi:hypothetical protein
MKRHSTLLPTLGLLTLLAACGGGEAPAGDTDTGAAPASTPAAAPAASTGGGGTGGLSCPASAQAPQHQALSFSLGASPALLCYGATSGGTVPTGQLWRMGADEPTTLHLSSRANVGGVALQPGSYSLYAMPGASEWEIFINSNLTGMPADIRASEVGSFTVAPGQLPTAADPLRYEFEEAAGGEPGGELLLMFGQTVVAIPIEA